MNLPILDPKPKGKPHDWSYSKIQEVKGVVAPPIPDSYKFPLYIHLAHQDQSVRGTCVGQSSAYLENLNYMKLTGDIPTPEDKKQYQKNVKDPNGVTIHDILYPNSFSAECYYQISRNIGNVTYPSGSEIRYAARAMVDFGGCLESDWFTDKSGRGVYLAPPDTKKVNSFANEHRAEGYAVIYNWDSIKQAIYEKGFVLGAIPVYENYQAIRGTDGTFPEPHGPIVGYHALCFYGYEPDKLLFLHSWGDFCGMYGSISRNYYNISAMDDQHFMVILDSNEVKIARQTFSSVEIVCSPQAKIYVNDNYSGDTPITISIEKGKDYIVEARADGYYPKKVSINEQIKTLVITLDQIPPKKTWIELVIKSVIEFIRRLLWR